MRFEYLSPAQGAVVEGLEDYEKIYALEQGEYLPLRTLPGQQGNSAIYRCELTPEQREMVSEGSDVLVEIVHFKGPLAPSRVMIVDQSLLWQGEAKKMWSSWMQSPLENLQLPLTKKQQEIFTSQVFYELMQAYRNAPVTDQAQVVAAYKAVIAYIQAYIGIE
jgi:hypothetical protein